MARRGRAKRQLDDFHLARDVRDDVAENLLAALEGSPEDDDIRSMLADRLDDLGPTWVDLGHMPNWFRLAWIRAVQTDRYHLDGWSVWCAIKERYDREEFGYNVVDHAGSCLLFGRVCLVTEPYNWHRDRLLDAMKSIAATVVIGIPVVCGRTAHASEYEMQQLKRALIIPPVGV